MRSTTLNDILRDCGDVAIVCVCENGIEHGYIGEDDIATIDQDILDMPVEIYFVVRKSDGLLVFVEI